MKKIQSFDHLWNYITLKLSEYASPKKTMF